jgi:hypothetical protein
MSTTAILNSAGRHERGVEIGVLDEAAESIGSDRCSRWGRRDLPLLNVARQHDGTTGAPV